MGDAAQLATKPLIRLMRKEVRDMWSYYESGFHNLLVVSVDSRYSREAMKTAFGILGEGQLSLTKVMVLVDSSTDPSDTKAVARAISRNFRVETDFRLLARTAQDTLDFTGDSFQHGSKMVLDATGYGHEPQRIDGPQLRFDPKSLSSANHESSSALRQHLGFASTARICGIPRPDRARRRRSEGTFAQSRCPSIGGRGI